MQIRFDGYSFGDRTLEGVMFIADIKPSGKLGKVYIDPAYDDVYWNGLNKTMWLKEAKKYITGALINCNNDIQMMIDEGYQII